MKIKILGCGEAFDSEGLGNNACVLYGAGLPTVIFDCGYQIPERLWRHPKIYKNLNAIYFTHAHADHYFGIVPLVTRFKEEGRSADLRIFGPKGIAGKVLSLLKLGYPGSADRPGFRLVFKELRGQESFRLENLKFRCAVSAHSQFNLSVRVTGPGGRGFAVSGDGNLTPATRKLYDGVDLLLHECFWLKQGANCHASLEAIRGFADAHRVGRIGVTHLSRYYRKQIVNAVTALRRKDRRFFVARVGQVIEI